MIDSFLFVVATYAAVSTMILIACNYMGAPLIGPYETHRVRAYLSLWFAFLVMWPAAVYVELKERRKEAR